MKFIIRLPGRQLGAFAAILMLVSACSSSKAPSNEPTDAQIEEGVIRQLQEVQRKYAPDPRLSIFKIIPQKQGDRLILKGEVDNADAKKELVEVFARMGIKAVDRITLLPSEKLGSNVWGLVRISVANLREDTAPSAELGTQVLMGNVIRIWKQQGGWYYVQASDRYLGWIEDDVFIPCTKEQVNVWNSADRVIVTAYEDRVWPEPKTENAFPVSDVVMGVLLKKTGEEGDWFKVELPDGRVGYLAKNSAADYEAWRTSRQATGDNIERTAKSFLGFPYLWGGTSSKGMDCSGFTKLVYAMNGIPLMRNASQQVRQGMEVPIDANLTNLNKGDLLFFGFKDDKRRLEKVTHVGIYLGGKKFIQASGMVKISSLDPKSSLLDERRLKMLLHARRYLTE